MIHAADAAQSNIANAGMYRRITIYLSAATRENCIFVRVMVPAGEPPEDRLQPSRRVGAISISPIFLTVMHSQARSEFRGLGAEIPGAQ
jgi:hypothetical protein